MFDSIGELRFAVSWLANAVSRVKLVAAKPPAAAGDEPHILQRPNPYDDNPVELSPTELLAVEAVEKIAGGIAGQAQFLAGLTKQLSVPGIGYVYAALLDDTDDLDPASWRVLSAEEVRRPLGGGSIEVADAMTGHFEPIGEDDTLIKVWRPHPARAWEADSPVQGLLPVLRVLDIINRRVIADLESRLAGAGLIAFPDEVDFSDFLPIVEDGDDPDEFGEPSDLQGFMDEWANYVGRAMEDQDNARVPFAVQVPDSLIEHFGKRITFESPMDDRLMPLWEAATRRLALGLDMPPEILTGLGETNHWNAWEITDEAIRMQIVPVVAMIADALTAQYLRPLLETAEGVESDEVMVWFDVTDLTTRPDLTTAVQKAFDVGEASAAALRRESGLDEADAPTPDERRERILVEIAKGSPTVGPLILAVLGILSDDEAAKISEAARAWESERRRSAPVTPAEGSSPDRSPPEAPSDDSGSASAAALLASLDVVCERAFERAGNRLRTLAAKGNPKGTEGVPCDDPATFHCSYSMNGQTPFGHLFEGAWERVELIASRYGFDPVVVRRRVAAYAIDRYMNGEPHDFDALADCLQLRFASAVAG